MKSKSIGFIEPKKKSRFRLYARNWDWLPGDKKIFGKRAKNIAISFITKEVIVYSQRRNTLKRLFTHE